MPRRMAGEAHGRRRRGFQRKDLLCENEDHSHAPDLGCVGVRSFRWLCGNLWTVGLYWKKGWESVFRSLAVCRLQFACCEVL